MSASLPSRISAPTYERGVYWAMGTKNGKPQVFALDSRGNEVRRLVLNDDSWAEAEAAIEELWQYLDEIDPVPQIRLVKPVALPPTTRKAVPEYDPYNDVRGVPGPRRMRWDIS